MKNPWFHFPRPLAKPALRLFCFSYAGGGASTFRKWPQWLPESAEVCAVQLPGRENRLKEPPYTRLFDLVGALAGGIGPYTDIPFAFFGHSMGALVAFALARKLRNSQLPEPVHLMVSGRRAPHLIDDDPPLHELPEQEFIEEIRELNGTVDAVLQDSELMELLLPVLRADFAVCESYEYEPEEPLACSISAFGSTQDREATRDDVAAWYHHTSGSFTLNMFPGDHFYLNDKPDHLFHTMAFQLAGIIDRIGMVRNRG